MINKIKAEIERRIEEYNIQSRSGAELAYLLSFIESLEKEQAPIEQATEELWQSIPNKTHAIYDRIKAYGEHCYELGFRHAAVLYDDMEKERQRRCESVPTIKSWVARDIHGTLRLYGNDAADGMGIRTGELPSPYKELTAEDKPIEVELTISLVKTE